MPETPRLRHGNRNPQNLYLLREDGSEEFAGVAMTPEYADMIVQRFNATADAEADIRADERRKVAEEIAATLEEKAAKVRDEALAFSEMRGISEKLLARSGAIANAAVIAREMGALRELR
jgi:hypothetical protein